jgi:NAD(P)-dependent dehydrogenase (short-subunit alcohol dehydrogenase family)
MRVSRPFYATISSVERTEDIEVLGGGNRMSGGIFSIAGKRTLITGGAAGIGHGIASHFRTQGAEVTIADLRPEGRVVADDIGAGFVEMDVTDEASVSSGLATATEQLGGSIDVLVLNAGIDLDVGIAGNLNLAAFGKVMDVNFRGVVNGLAFGPAHMDDGSVILITSSPAGRVTLEGLGAYSASKAAIDSLTRTAAIELAPRGIRVNAVLPGIVKTEMGGGATGEGSSLAILTATGIRREPSELAPVYQFLASPAAAPITGATVQADDGMTAGLSTLLMNAAFGPSGLQAGA